MKIVSSSRGRNALKRQSERALARLSRDIATPLADETAAFTGILPVDGGLAHSAEFAPAEVERRTALLKVQLVEQYVAEFDQSLAELLADYRMFADLAERAQAAALDRHERARTLAIHDQEVKAGWYTRDRDMSARELAGQNAWSEAAALSFKTLKEGLDDVDDAKLDPDLVSHFRGCIAMATAFTVYAKPHSTNAPKKTNFDFLHMTDPHFSPGTPPAFKVADTNSTNVYPVPGLLYSMVRAQAQPEAIYNQALVASQAALAEGASVSSSALRDAKALAHEWTTKDVDFRRARTELAIEVHDLKVTAQDEQRSASNHPERLAEVRTAFRDRAAEFYCRANFVYGQIEALWDWTPMPQAPAVGGWDDAAGSWLQSTASWHREFKRQFLSRLAGEASTCLPFSVKALCGTGTWQDALADVKARDLPLLELQFILSPAAVPRLFGLRLRGVSAHSVGITDARAGVWSANLRPPVQCSVVTSRGTRDLNQNPGCIDLGRIQTREFPKPPDVVATATLRNLSPLSAGAGNDRSWALTLKRHSSRGKDVCDLEDLEIDLLVAGSLS